MVEWTDKLAGARMQVDQQFQDRVQRSQFSNQEWGMIMTAVEFEVRHPDDPEAAQLVAVTEHVSDIIPELDKITAQAEGPGGGRSGGIGDRLSGLLETLTGNGKSDTEGKRRDAEALATEYARQLQAFLEERNQWTEIRQAAAADRGPSETR